jgi:hypothetical protein
MMFKIYLCIAFLIAFSATVSAQATLLPTFAPIYNGTNYNGKSYIFYVSMINNGQGTGGLWLNDIQGCKDGAYWNFQTQSPFFVRVGIPQVSFRLKGDFIWALETGYVFTMDLTDSLNMGRLLTADHEITTSLEFVWTTLMAPFKKSMTLDSAPIPSVADFPTFDTTLNLGEFYVFYTGLYHGTASHNTWPAAFLGLLQALVWCETEVNNPTYYEQCNSQSGVLSYVTTNLLQLKTNEYNTDRQCTILPCTDENPLPYNTPWINGHYLCSV